MVLPKAERDRLVLVAGSTTKRWAEAEFADEYESLRAFLGSGTERTGRMEDLFATTVRNLRLGDPDMIHLPGELLEVRKVVSGGAMQAGALVWAFYWPHSGLWTETETTMLLESNDAGKRLFALTLMESRTALASLDAIVPLIEDSFSAFEQYRALRLVHRLVPTLEVPERERLRAVLTRQRRRYIVPGTDRYELSVEIERAIEGRQ